jgi:hypothetical protein
MAGTQRALQGERWVLFGNRIAARFALLCLVAYVLNAHHVVTCHANTNLYYIYISTRTYKYVQNKLLHWSHDCDMAPVETKVEQPSSSQLVFFPYLQFVWRHYAAIFKRLSLGALVSAIHQTDYQRTFLYVGINCHSRLSCWTIKPAVN